MSQSIDGFEILSKVGEGGMASVWKARQVSLDRIVAIKVLSAKFSSDLEDVRRFQQEAQSTAKLKHPGIIQVYDANVKAGLYYFVMEYISGYTVGDWVRRKGVLKEKDALLVAECVADALGDAWEKERVIHCDIKPDNVMIDEDGTVKLADLGLARTISTMTAAADTDEVMGTPAYMSPEQVQGRQDLDCRADIYSLGAMLYHLVTGRMLFEGADDDDVMRKQICDTVDDPMDINPQLSKGICWLIERMTAKDVEFREDGWDAVRADIVRVRRGLLPLGRPLPDGHSTVRRSAKRTPGNYNRVVAFQKAALSSYHPITRGLVMGVAVLLVLLTFLLWDEGCTRPVVVPSSAQSPRPVSANPPPAVTSTVTPVSPAEISETEEEKALGRRFKYLQKWMSTHPGRYWEAIAQFRTLAEESVGSRYALLARQEALRLEKERETVIDTTMASLNGRVAALVDAGELSSAIELLDAYDGPVALETKETRRELADDLRLRAAAQRKQKAIASNEEKARVKEGIDGIIAAIYHNDVAGALELLDALEYGPGFGKHAHAIAEIRSILQAVNGMDATILDSFSADVGRTISVRLNSGSKNVTVESVGDGVVSCQLMTQAGRGISVSIQFGVDDLTTVERLKRMGSDSEPAVALAKGLMALESKAIPYAEKYFRQTHPFLAERLCARLATEK